jgi:NDP-sugar pyrophosphorylase family protein
MKPTLLVLAAGLARRYGRLKQLEPVGPTGEAILDYSIFDALRSGFGNVLLVIRHEIEQAFREHARRRWQGLPVDFVFQENSPGPDAITRHKPWGTTYAVVAAESAIDRPFGVMNADDFYGRGAIALLATALQQIGGLEAGVLVGYPLPATLSPHGGVSRAVCRVDAEGWLTGIVECTDVRRDGEAIRGTVAGRPLTLPPDAIVSMNLWGFTPRVLAPLRAGFEAFRASHAGDADAEYALPDAVSRLIEAGERLRVIRAPDGWMGMTYAEDRETAVAHIATLVNAGTYPQVLFTAD